MKENRYTQCILCEGKTFQEAVDKFNLEMQRHRTLNPTFERAGETFLIYVKVTELTPESIVEAKHLEGCDHLCEDCTLCERLYNLSGEIDKRKKFGYCHKDGLRTKIRIDQDVCDAFYIEDLERMKGGIR